MIDHNCPRCQTLPAEALTPETRLSLKFTPHQLIERLQAFADDAEANGEAWEHAVFSQAAALLAAQNTQGQTTPAKK